MSTGPLTRSEIRRAADNILDRPTADPDDDAAILARFTVRYLDGPSPALDDRSATMRWTALEAVRSLVGDHDIHKTRQQDCAVCRFFLADAEPDCTALNGSATADTNAAWFTGYQQAISDIRHHKSSPYHDQIVLMTSQALRWRHVLGWLDLPYNATSGEIEAAILAFEVREGMAPCSDDVHSYLLETEPPVVPISALRDLLDEPTFDRVMAAFEEKA